jgi:hypothetical protein
MASYVFLFFLPVQKVIHPQQQAILQQQLIGN